MAGDLQNAYLPADVNGDLRVSALDALLVINQLQQDAANPVSESDSGSLIFPDVSGDGRVSALDALKVVNVLNRQPDLYSMRLANDTAPGGTTNDDQITSDFTIEGHLNWPEISSSESRRAFLSGKDNFGHYEEIELSRYTTGDFFRVPDHAMSVFASYGPSVGDTFVIHLNIEVDDIPLSSPRPSLEVFYDQRSPSLSLPSYVGREADSLSLVVNDASGVTAGSLTTLTFAAMGDDPSHTSSLDFEIERQADRNRDLIDISLESLSLGPNEILSLRLDGYLDDLAGNRLEYSGDLLLRQGQTQSPGGSDAFDPTSVVAARGQAFRDDVATANPGQVITVPLPIGGGSRITFPVLEPNDKTDDPPELKRQQAYLHDIDRLAGTATVQVPWNAISGPLLGSDGDHLLDLHLVPDPNGSVQIGRGFISTDPVRLNQSWVLRSLGGAYSDSSHHYFYRLLTEDEVVQWEQRDLSDSITPSDVSQWSPLVHLAPAPRLGFQFIQVAGPDGVSDPQPLQSSLPQLGKINALTYTDDFQSFWLASPGQIIRSDVQTSEVQGGVLRSNLLADLSSAQPVLNKAFVVESLQEVPGSDLTAVMERTSESSLNPDGIYLIAWMSNESSPTPGWVIDPETGKTIGIINEALFDAIDRELYFAPVFETTRQVWFRLKRDLSQWEQISAVDATVTDSGGDAGIPVLHTLPGDWQNEQQRLDWDPVNQQVLLTSIGVPFGESFSTVVTSAFDFDARVFRESEGPDEFAPFVRSLTPDVRGDVRHIMALSERLFANTPPTPIRPSDVPQPVESTLTAILSQATFGEPAQPTISSANPGQTIEVMGTGFSEFTELEFTTDGSTIYKQTLRESPFTQRVTPIWVSEDRTKARFQVPEYAVTAPVRLTDSEQTLPLQIVPQIALPDEITSGSRDRSSVRHYGFSNVASRAFQVWVDEKFAWGCRDVLLSETCNDFVHANTAVEISRSLELVTLGGRDRIEYKPTQGSADLQMDQVINVTPVLGHAFSYEGMKSDQYLAGSEVIFTVAHDDSPSTGDNPWPPSVWVDLLLPFHDTQLQHFRTIRADHVNDGEYRLCLPFDYAGGWIVPRGTLPVSQEAADDLGLRIEIVPTVIAATGDSDLPGSNLLFHGANLSEVEFSIDGVPVEKNQLTSATSMSTYQIEVPAGVDHGRITFRAATLAASLERLDPWWIDDAMPVANQGNPNFSDLPSINDDQAFDFAFQSNGSTSEHPFRFIRDSEVWRADFFEAAGDQTDDGRTIASYEPHVFNLFEGIFGSSSDAILHLIPILPRVSQSFAGGVKVQEQSSGLVIPQISFLTSEFSDLSIRWGGQSWTLDRDNLVWKKVTLPSGVTQHVRTLSPTNDAESVTFIASSTSSNSNRLPGNWKTMLSFIPEERPWDIEAPILVGNHWGNSEVPAPDPQELAAVIAAINTGAGTPRDPNLPSIHFGPGDRILDENTIFAGLFYQDPNSPTEESQPAQQTRWLAFPMEYRLLEMPDQLQSGWVRYGLGGDPFYLQVVPFLSARPINRSQSIRIDLRGVDDSSRLIIEDKIFPLTEDEVRQGALILSISDPRFASLRNFDQPLSAFVDSRGGTSAAIMISTTDLS
ncbi:dockerin type I domain-containing protein [Rhodopirellula europaea]|uniref:Uncharacterized protein n=1 Tax=Rhodopirellula europaea 6C TaxID=1263867 RepID=M2B8N2_9BACT|nr:dockerin type I domain-containing protein [Rhodopirellula europaea]EMB18058.1 hypothetical protein RE6C_01140 [Rhodopirellula europaea 6C]